LADEIDKMRSFYETLARRVRANIEVSGTEDKVKDLIVVENEKILAGKVDFLIEKGIMRKNDEMAVVDNTFIVGREHLPGHLEALKEIYKKLYPRGDYPADTVVLVDGLYRKEFLLET